MAPRHLPENHTIIQTLLRVTVNTFRPRAQSAFQLLYLDRRDKSLTQDSSKESRAKDEQ